MPILLRRWFAQAAYYPSLWWNMWQGRLTHRWEWWTVLEPDLILGAVPFRGDVERLRRLGVLAVVNTCEEFAGHTDLYERYKIEQFWMPTVDFSPPTLEDIQRAVEFMQDQMAAGHAVYVHCKAGRARSVTVVICYLMATRGWTAEAAQAWIQTRRPQVLRSVFQRAVVKEFAKRLADSAQTPTPAV